MKTDLITANPAPVVVDFSASPSSGVNPLTVAFTDTTSGASIDTWSWKFGDGSVSVWQDPVHQYTAPGDYSVALTVFVGPQSDVLDKIDFTDTSTGATATAWSLDFGGGGSSTQQNPTHTYTLPGTHDVSLTVSIGQQPETIVKTDYVTVEHASMIVPLFSAPTFVVGQGASSVAVGDFDGDGTSDLVTANSALSGVSILLGQGDGSFTLVGNYGAGTTRSIAVGEFNGDGVPDLVIPDVISSPDSPDNSGDPEGHNCPSGYTSILLGAGDGSFVQSASISTTA